MALYIGRGNQIHCAVWSFGGTGDTEAHKTYTSDTSFNNFIRLHTNIFTGVGPLCLFVTRRWWRRRHQIRLWQISVCARDDSDDAVLWECSVWLSATIYIHNTHTQTVLIFPNWSCVSNFCGSTYNVRTNLLPAINVVQIHYLCATRAFLIYQIITLAWPCAFYALSHSVCSALLTLSSHMVIHSRANVTSLFI